MRKRYTVILIPDQEGEGFTVEVPLLPGCITEGDTVEEALRNAREAIEVHVEGLSLAGDEVPDETVPVIVAAVEANPKLGRKRLDTHTSH